MIDWVWLSHIPLLSYVPTNLNLVYFNFNFCIENWQQTISFLKLESNLMINAVSVKKARKLFCTSFGNARSLNPFGMICRFSCPHKFLQQSITIEGVFLTTGLNDCIYLLCINSFLFFSDSFLTRRREQKGHETAEGRSSIFLNMHNPRMRLC